MQRSAVIGVVALLLAAYACAEGATGLPAGVRLPQIEGGFPPPQVIEGVPGFRAQSLTLVDIPEAGGPRVSLFNGKDLGEFTPWLGYRNGGLFPTDDKDRPLGETGMGEVFQVVEDEGQPTIYITGRIYGALNSRRDLANYHLHLKFKYGRQWGEHPRDSGILFHSYGPYGAFSGTFMNSIEFEMHTAQVGLMVPVGKAVTVDVELGKGAGPGVFGGDNFQYMPGGKRVTVRLPTPVRESRDVERPVGQWNELDLYAAGDAAVYVVNGAPVMAITGITLAGTDGARNPLTHGRIQLESEGAEVFIRDLWYEPIATVPRIAVDCCVSSRSMPMKNPLGLKAHHVTARVRDIEAVKAWYQKVLGLELVSQGERLEGKMKYATLALPGYAISFVQLDQPAVDAAPGMGMVPIWAHPVFSVPDPDRVYNQLVALGVRVAIYGPKPTPVRTFVFYDCEGNELEIVPEDT